MDKDTELVMVNMLSPVARKCADKLVEAIDANEALKPVPVPNQDVTGLPAAAVPVLATVLTEIVAEVIQYYIDAGSERDVTHECLGPAIENELWGWSAAVDHEKVPHYGVGAFELQTTLNGVYRRLAGVDG